MSSHGARQTGKPIQTVKVSKFIHGMGKSQVIVWGVDLCLYIAKTLIFVYKLCPMYLNIYSFHFKHLFIIYMHSILQAVLLQCLKKVMVQVKLLCHVSVFVICILCDHKNSIFLFC